VEGSNKLNDLNDSYFDKQYSELIQEGTGGTFAKHIHKQLEKNLNADFYGIVLELGALNGYHKQFVQHGYSLYYETDILIKETELISKNYIRKFQDAENLSDIEDNSIDRVLATCMISHLLDPEKCLFEIKRVIKKGGVISLWVANDPSILLRILQIVVRKRKFNKHGLDYDSLQFRQHINYFTRINYLINDVFSDCKIIKTQMPLRGIWYHLNLAAVYQIHT
tara:strand:- start:465 stop:1133 length:669 start_codon:yes stop_codon:yes gene_type:complete